MFGSCVRWEAVVFLFLLVLKLLNLTLTWGLSTLDPRSCRHAAPADRRAGLLFKGGWWQLGGGKMAFVLKDRDLKQGHRGEK